VPVRPYLHFLISWWGLIVLAALDTSVIFTLPIALDAVVVLMSALHREVFWLVPILATAGALVGAAASIKVGEFVGEQGLSRWVPPKIFNRIKQRVAGRRVAALIVAPLMPPPFPLTAVLVAAGALDAGRARVLSAIAIGFMVRFSIESLLALVYGRRIIQWLDSDVVRDVAIGLIVIALIGSAISIVRLARSPRRRRHRN
jgi:membrane protein YqaA with SNARE-associated domain